MELEQQREVESIKRDIQALEVQENELMRQVEQLQARKQMLFDQMAALSDEKYEQDVLEQLYRQKRERQKKK